MASVNVILQEDPACRVLLPHLIQDRKDETIRPRSLYCPFITAMPGFFKDDRTARRVFAPVLDLDRDLAWQADQVKGFLKEAGMKGVSVRRIRKALKEGMARLEDHRIELAKRSRQVLDAVSDERTIVLLGRPYNLHHRILNLGIPELIESLGCRVVTMDALPDEATSSDLAAHFPDMYWYQGQRILRKALDVRTRPNLFPLMISNFSCGPDSFILTYFEEICRGKPYLILELDEHGSAIGYQTRIEAFLDMIEQYRGEGLSAAPLSKPMNIRYGIVDVMHDTKVWIPQIHPYIPQLWSAVLNRYGFDTSPMGDETAEQCAAGRTVCRGSECLPAAVTTGKFLSVVKEYSGNTWHALFMPRAEGPCRFGQYATLQSLVLGRSGLENTLIFSPTSEDGYAFLSHKAETDVWRAICLGDALFKLRCRMVPYHRHPLMAEALINEVLGEICGLIRAGKDWKIAVKSLLATLDIDSELDGPARPLVGIVGEIFVRLNTFSNQHIVEAVEAFGGEAWLSPMAEWIYYVWELMAMKSGMAGKLSRRLKLRYIRSIEREIMALFSPVLDSRHEPAVAVVMARAARFVPVEFEGESILTLGRAMLFAEQGARLVVNCSPFGCMPGRITSHLFQTCRDYFKVPVVNLFYDGTGDVSSQVGIYLRSITQAMSDERTGLSSSFRRLEKRPEHPPRATIPGKGRGKDLSQGPEKHREDG
jgi:predicted nucleotide-binding protein (sugar kinase/HSP70/actin superfamily)